jgi:hypothetical protein
MSEKRGIPTVYQGYEFRSRLEARWAAFFDQLGWAWEFEPFDLDGWIPDFQLADFAEPMLVEIKPAATWVECLDSTARIEASGWVGPALITTCAPNRETDMMGVSTWMPTRSRDWSRTYLGCVLGGSCKAANGLVWDGGPVSPDDPSDGARVAVCLRCDESGDYRMDPWPGSIAAKWGAACNKTKWLPRSGVKGR